MPLKTAKQPAKGQSASVLVLIGVYKLLESALLIAAGIGAIRLLHRDMQTVLNHWVHVLRVDPDNRYIHKVLEKALQVSPRQLRELSAGTFFYAALRLAEGFGLVLRKRWGEYLTVFSTAVFIPLEIYELFHRYRPSKLLLLLINVAIVWYLIRGLRRTSRR